MALQKVLTTRLRFSKETHMATAILIDLGKEYSTFLTIKKKESPK